MPSAFMQTYQAHVAERAALGIPPLPLSAKQVEALIEEIKKPTAGEESR
jgi:aconitate hydratase 2 / 2-methylisocitrate dehydratase